ncbi:glutamate cyclase domain-containing protein [Thalassoroseus pseudoceratinae]|uniref:glutamate cyclase domain-containing protein n=1 Tax=Thalassoroseus pseudoceratinae TaxID=2713176 RepID=UPI00141F5CAA|nr:glutamate cyclase domain-containing protein [Thalassoroseus pseudoceratinae]
MTGSEIISDIERFVRTDPARRGLIASEEEFPPLCLGHLASAAEELAANGTSIGIVTGYFVPRANPPAAETDGPLGAAILARFFRDLGRKVDLITDPFCADAVRVAAEAYGLPRDIVRMFDTNSHGNLQFDDTATTPEWTHLISIERSGPAHTFESVSRDDEDRQRFAELVPKTAWNRCHNMLGDVIDEWTPPLHQLFEHVTQGDQRPTTIGVGDGGNEIGFGAVAWTDLIRRLPPASPPCIPCRISTDWTIVTGVSNWGGYAIASAVAVILNEVSRLQPFDRIHEQAALESLVRRGPAVDGVTARPDPTVDGLPFLTYIQPWQSIRRRLGLTSN